MDPNANCPSLFNRVFLSGTFISAFSFNTLFLYLIYKHSSVIISPYKRVLVVSAVSDILCSAAFMLVIVRPHLIDHEGRQLALLSFDGLLPNLFYKHFGSTGLYFSLGVMEICAAFVAAYNCIPFVYRYLFVCSSHRVSYFQFFFMLYAIFLMGFGMASSSVYLSISNQRFNFPQTYIWGENRDCLPLLPTPDTHSTYPDKFSQVMRGMFYLSSNLIIGTYGVTVFCGWKIAKFLRGKDCLPSVLRYNNQISMTLAVQTLSPILAVGIPGFFSTVAFICGYKVSFLISWATLGMSLIPTINPVSAILLLTCYRRALFPRWYIRNQRRRELTKSVSIV